MRRWILLLVFLAGSCAQPTEQAAAAYDRAAAALERGDLQGARDLVRKQLDGWTQRRSPLYSRLRLLDAEILIAQGRAGDAAKLIEEPIAPDENAAALEARRLKIRGHAALNLGRFDEAKRALDEAESSAEAAGLPRLAVEVEVLRGLMLIRTNDAAGATVTQAAYQRAVEQQDAYWQAAALNNLGLERMRSFHYDEAVPYLEQALKAGSAAQARRFSAASLANLGTCYYRIGDFDKALASLQQAIGVQEQIGALAGLQSSLGDIGNVHFMQGHADRAVEFYQRALSLARANAPGDASKWAGNLAAAHAELKHWDDAERFNRESLTLQQESGDPHSLAYAKLDAAAIAAGREQPEQAVALYQEALALARDNAELTWEANAGLGAVYTALKAPEQASLVFERCLQTIDAARAALSNSDYKLTFLSRLIRFYQAYVDVLVSRGETEKALQVADSSRALLLSERLELGGDRRTAVTRASLQRAARRLGAVFMSYWLAPDRSFLWVVTPDRFELLELPGRDRINALVEAYRGFIENSVRDPLTAEFPAAKQLYDLLIAPARPFVPPGSRIVLVPDGSLHALNVETLPVSSSSHYFIEEATVAVAPALALLVAPLPPRPAAGNALLLIGDADPAGPDFPRLAEAGREIHAIRDRFPARVTVLTGSEATPAAYERAKPGQYSMIHFAAHATANRASPLDSAVILSPHADGFMLTARDVLQSPIHANLVTISACRSAGATIYGGEGIVGFVWAFLQAGARNVIAGLWDVSDRSTSQLMDTLYSRLNAGASPADALRAAKLALIATRGNFANPYYWGPFQLYVGQ